MKKIIVFLMSVFVSVFSATAQNITEFFKTQKANKNVEYIHIAPEALNIVSKLTTLVTVFSDESSKEETKIVGLVSKMVDDLDDFGFIIAKTKKVDLWRNLKKSKLLETGKYKLLNEISNKDEDMAIYSKGLKKDIVQNLIIVLEDKGNKTTLIANMDGAIKLVKVAELIEVVSKDVKKK